MTSVPTEAQARANERPGERSSGFTAFGVTDLQETLVAAMADRAVTRFYVEKPTEGVFVGVVYRESSESFLPPSAA